MVTGHNPQADAQKTASTKGTDGKDGQEVKSQARSLFHELPKDERDRVMKSSITVEQFNQKYKQPDWCNYPEALNGRMGCWSLFYTPEKINKFFCSTCDSCAKELERQDLKTGGVTG